MENEWFFQRWFRILFGPFEIKELYVIKTTKEFYIKRYENKKILEIEDFIYYELKITKIELDELQTFASIGLLKIEKSTKCSLATNN